MAGYAFHPDALLEYADATHYYIHTASPELAERFAESVESAVMRIVAAPGRWRIVEQPEIRRLLLKRFPYAVYYHWDTEQEFVTIFAVMHCSREPGYWKERLG